MLRDAVAAMPWLVLAMSRLANANCECGYSVNKTSDPSFAVYTNLLENDFLHIKTDNVTEFGWRAQEYNVSAEDARGPYGKEFFIENIETNPLKDANAWTGDSDHGGDAGLQLWVRGDHSHGYVSGAEMATVRNDTLYGSYRIGMKLSAESGTCGAFFWFYNNSQEIDLEFLSHQFNQSQGAVNLVLQTPQSVIHGYDASNTSDFKVQSLDFRPDERFHEYRFDWSPESVQFYVDGKILQVMTNNIPTMPGRMFVNHWSNGDPKWSAGPPERDTSMTISYIKAYFNSSDTAQNDEYKSRCANFDPSKVCQIPDQTVPPDGSLGDANAAKTYFFTQDKDHAPGQEVFATTNGASSGVIRLFGAAYLPLLVALVSCIVGL
ncbi:concanavalin A-like lectin/glucanase [Polyplosphaeria fusca]|uniref:Concanavalin A-like lectin/glucanase n=1 Tax=Polyplosphaeria fusca TaxID=682080 RepID=A0A9P4QZJ6_9PLEO|nr:concanavalin A-like lectin/glucanase [Polyplosphaeria fusca]